MSKRQPSIAKSKRYGIYRAEVINNLDPLASRRVLVRLPAGLIDGRGLDDVWAPVATVFGDSHSASWFRPNVGDQVLVSFEAGDVRRPIVLGVLPSEGMAEVPLNPQRVLRSPAGVQMVFDDTPGQEQLLLETPGGPAVRLRCGSGRIEITDPSGNTITLGGGGITLKAAASVEISAPALTVSVGVAKFPGVVQCDTLIANNVVASSYTPGAGNVA